MEQSRKAVLQNRFIENHKKAVARKANILSELEPINRELEKNYNNYLNYGIKRDEYNCQIDEYNNIISDLQKRKIHTKRELDKEPQRHKDIIVKEDNVLENELLRISEKICDAKDEWHQTKSEAICCREHHNIQLNNKQLYKLINEISYC